jgi:hypothetical protein
MSSRVVVLPPTSDFPSDPVPLSRDALNSAYLELRNSYKSSMRSRGQHRSQASKAREETAQLKQRLLDLAAREASVRTDIYQMLEIVTAIAGDLEDSVKILSKNLAITSLAAGPTKAVFLLVASCRL